jgi:hypothetical protein
VEDDTGPILSPAAARVLATVGGAGVLDRLAELSGSDFTSLMLYLASSPGYKRHRRASTQPALHGRLHRRRDGGGPVRLYCHTRIWCLYGEQEGDDHPR